MTVSTVDSKLDMLHYNSDSLVIFEDKLLQPFRLESILINRNTSNILCLEGLMSVVLDILVVVHVAIGFNIQHCSL